jgi:large subunit ribosomal protein L22
MSVTVKQKFIHMTARKMRLVADSIRGKTTDNALSVLYIMPKAAAKPVYHAVKSAVSAAKQANPSGSFIISSIYVDEGPAIKRRILRSRGRASRMEHRMSHLTLTLDALETEKKRTPKTDTAAIQEVENVS